MSKGTLAIVVALAIAMIQLAIYLPGMREPFPAHFGVNGAPDAWTTRGGFLAIQVFIVGLALAFAYVVPLWIDRLPRDEVVRGRYRPALRAIGAATIALSVVINQMVYTSARAGAPRVSPAGVLIAIAAYTAVVLVIAFRTRIPSRHPASSGSGS